MGCIATPIRQLELGAHMAHLILATRRVQWMQRGNPCTFFEELPDVLCHVREAG